MSADRRAWLEGQVASARMLLGDVDASGPFGDGGMAAHVADLEEQLDGREPAGSRGRPKVVDGFQSRNRLDMQTPAEAAIRDAVDAVERAGAHPLLTEAIILLHEALDRLADYVELEP